MPGEVIPRISVWNRQRGVRLEAACLQSLAVSALPFCQALSGRGDAVLAGLEEVEVTIVSDRVIARVHQQFMAIPGATDVITFDHGEIVVSATTAAREAGEQGEPVKREIFRYIVHGLLHLNGHEDVQPEEAATMWQAQEAVVNRLWPLPR